MMPPSSYIVGCGHEIELPAPTTQIVHVEPCTVFGCGCELVLPATAVEVAIVATPSYV